MGRRKLPVYRKWFKYKCSAHGEYHKRTSERPRQYRVPNGEVLDRLRPVYRARDARGALVEPKHGDYICSDFFINKTEGRHRSVATFLANLKTEMIGRDFDSNPATSPRTARAQNRADDGANPDLLRNLERQRSRKRRRDSAMEVESKVESETKQSIDWWC